MTVRALLAVAAMLTLPAQAWPGRSGSAAAQFKQTHPCPATGKVSARAACPGWQIDHITPLKCGGADHPSNMQWLTIEQHKAKTKAEAKLCRKIHQRHMPSDQSEVPYS